MSNLIVSAIWRGVDWKDSGLLWSVSSDGNLLEDPFYINRDPMIKRPSVEKIGHRSARGVCYWGESYWVAGYDFIAKLGVGPFTIESVHRHPDCLDIHNIYDAGDNILVTSTYNNSIFRFDGDRFTKILDLTDVFVNTNTPPDTLHLNSLLGDYAILCTYENINSAVVNMKEKRVVFSNEEYMFGHDLQKIGTGEYVTNSSGKSKLIAFREDGSFRVLFDYKEYRSGEDSALSKWGWVRGLCYDEDSDILFMGAPPAAVFVFSNVSTNMKLEREIPLYKYVDLGFHIDLSVFDIIFREE